MPVRVKCRCGQEIVLRYGEWVYVFLGLVLLSVLVNMLALLLLYLRLDETTTPAVQPAAVEKEAPTNSDPGAVDVPAGAWGNPRGLEPPREGEAGAPLAGHGSVPPSRASEGSGGLERPRPLRNLSEGGPSTALLEDLVGEPADAAPSPVEPEPPDEPEPRSGHPWIEEPVLIRLLLLERSLGTETLIAHALLSDPDPHIRRRAVARVSSGSLPAESTTRGKRARVLIRYASAWLEKDPGGRRLLQFAGATVDGSSPELPSGTVFEKTVFDDADLEGTWKALRREADTLLSDRPTRALYDHVCQEAAGGTEMVLVVDVSRSMADALESLKREARWLLAAVSWALPETRVGLVLFRDGVDTVEGFSPTSGAEVLRAIGEARAEGGGDVTEGVHHALRAALSLGRFSWREGASRNVVLLGDAPPPYPERTGLVLLAGQAFRQGRYRCHVLSFDTGDEFHASSPCLPALARQGGGRSTRIGSTNRLGTEVLLCLFPRDAEPAAELVAATLRRMFAG